MKKFKLLISAAKIEYNWFLIKIIRKQQKRLLNRTETLKSREKALKFEANIDSLDYETLAELR